ncbi:MAG: glycosyltransferase family 2 protein [Candidatus Gracilibacteria bacterium]|nr:glycosyltransferase family 2 protein [Candidatus Gracilibacteria bacterium]
MPKIGVVCVTYNSEEYLSDLLTSLREQEGVKLELFFVDNDSKDKTVEFLNAHPSFGLSQDLRQGVRLVCNNKNLGFSKASNIGAKAALEAACDYVLFVNPDMVLAKDCLKQMLNCLGKKIIANDACKGAKFCAPSICQPKIYVHGKENRINTFGTSIQYLGMGYSAGGGIQNSKFKIQNEIPAASGACMLVKAEVFAKVGFFDDKFFMYCEDQDFSWRARMQGYEICLAEKARAWHKYDFQRAKRRKFYYLERNRLQFVLKNYQVKSLILLFPAFLVFELGMIFYSIFGLWVHYKLWSYIWLFLHIVTILKNRFKIQGKRNLTDRDLKKYLTGSVRSQGLGGFLWKYVGDPVLRWYWRLVRKII